MADIADITADRAEAEEQFRRLQAPKAQGPAATGTCLYCYCRLPQQMRWCDADCRNEWQEELRLQTRR